NIKLKLPLKLREFNKKIALKIKDTKYLITASFLLSIIISTGEFLCTGQIYLSKFLTIIYSNPEFNLISFLYLIIYNVFLIIPIILIVLILYKIKDILKNNIQFFSPRVPLKNTNSFSRMRIYFLAIPNSIFELSDFLGKNPHIIKILNIIIYIIIAVIIIF
ncbi:MAG: hypothetical protein ABF289_15945, partial [Clostridiales bacterium]